MSRLLEALAAHAAGQPDTSAIEGADDSLHLSYAELNAAVAAMANAFGRERFATMALLADNTPAWAVADFAAIAAAIPLIPVPHFFSPAQIRHLFHRAGVDVLLTDRPEQAMQLLQAIGIDFSEPSPMAAGHETLHAIRLKNMPRVELPAACAKVTFTSGSTGEPKGVCLSQLAMEEVAASLADATGAQASDRHLSVLPYATLLENIGGLYAPVLAGATVCAPGLAAIGLSGASGLDVRQFVTQLTSSGATTCIMIPQMLHALVSALTSGLPKPPALRFVAVGGAPVSHHLLAQAEQLGIPAFEGYGLSEAASVVAVNRPGACKYGTVGRPLPHVQIRFADDGEILVKGSLFAGYLGEPAFAGEYWPTGDIGRLDDEGYLHLSGRKKHIFITAFGRNVSPEWVERELTIEPAVAQACVYGEAKPFNVAVIVAREGADAQAVAAAVAAANARLPDYARVSRWVAATEPFSVANGQWTGTGRPRREHIARHYQTEINSVYEEHHL